MKWGGSAPLGELFETQLAAAVLGEPMRVDAGLGPRTEAALLRVARDTGECWETAAAARKAFGGETENAQLGRAAEWLRGRCFEVAEQVASAAMSWCSGRLHETGDERFRRQRRGLLHEFAALDPDRPEQVASWIAIHSAQIAQWRREEKAESNRSGLLSPGESGEIFDREIAPELLSDIREARYPTAVLVAGQPGVGLALGMRRQAAGLPNSVLVSAAVVTGFHPLAWECGGQIADDIAAWLARAARHVIGKRSDVVLGLGDSTRAAARCARMFGQAGYRMRHERVVVAEPVRRLSEAVCSATLAGSWPVVRAVAGGG